MRIKFLLPAIIAVALGTILAVSSFKFKNTGFSSYIPRGSTANKSDWAGAAEYYRMIKANIYTGKVEADDINRMNKALASKTNSKSLGLDWQSMGPSNVGGRTRAILIYDDNPNTVFAGSVSGGLFKSTNAGALWQRVQSFDEHLPIGSICRLGNGTIYVGTGSSHDGADGNGGSGFIGGGLFRSIDDGNTWEKVFSNDNVFDDGSQNDWKYVDGLVADPNDVNKLWIGKSDGLYPYFDGNASLEPVPSGLGTATCEDVEISGNVIVASIKSSLSVKVYVSTDGGASFSLTGVPPTTDGRIAVTVSKDDNNYMYAATVTNTGELKGIYASVDKGANWYDISGPASDLFNPYGNQGIYDNCIITVPGFPKKILIGGLTMFSWELVGEIPSISYFEPRTVYNGTNQDIFYVHPDVHEFQWGMQGDSAILYVGCDGGIFKSKDLGMSYFAANKGYVTGQFYGIGISGDGKVAGGLQDNGTQYLNFDGVEDTDARMIGGGDGFDTEISSLNGNFIFTTIYNNALFRSTDAGNSAASFTGLNIPSGIDENPGGDFYTDIRLYENRNNSFSQSVIPVTVFPELAGFVVDDTIINGSSAIGYFPADTVISFTSATGLLLYHNTTEPIFYYSNYNYINYNDSSIIDTITVVTSIDTIFANDTTFSYINLGEVPYGSDSADACNIFFGDTACYNFDTTFTVSTVVVDIIENTSTSYVYGFESTVVENVSDTLFARDYATSMLALSAQIGSGEIWVTRNPLETTSNSIWVKAASGVGTTVTSMEWSPDGNSLYIGFSGGSVKRISNWNNAWTPAQMTFGNPQYVLTTTTIKANSSGAVLGIGVDYSQGTGVGASERVLICQGGYGGSDKVKMSENAATATSATDANFVGIWNVESPYDEMPIYSVIMDKSDNQKIIAGTEYGMWSTDNGGGSWEESNGGDMVRVPVFELRQQWKPSTEVTNSGIIYAGTHGAGIMKSDNFYDPTSITDNGKKENISGINIFPNPIQSGNGNVQFMLRNNSNVGLYIYSITGKLIEKITNQNMTIGKNTISFNADKYATGTYVVQLVSDGTKKMGKFVVLK